MEPDPKEEILVSSGAMHALHVVLMALLQPRDEVLLISPCYFFGGLVSLAGARTVYVSMEEEERAYGLDFQKIRRHISARTKLIILNSPNNPTGYIYTHRDVEQFIELAEEHNLLLVSDESYDRMVYSGLEHVSPLHFVKGRPRTILVKSFTKSYALPAWRVGYIVAPASLAPYFRKVLEWTVLYCPYINQRVALVALNGPQEWLLEVFKSFEARRNQLLEGIRSIEGFSCVAPSGGPFVFLNHSSMCRDGPDQFARHLLYAYGIPAVSGRYFNSGDHVRIPFGGSEKEVDRLVAALAEAASRSRQTGRTLDGGHEKCSDRM